MPKCPKHNSTFIFFSLNCFNSIFYGFLFSTLHGTLVAAHSISTKYLVKIVNFNETCKSGVKALRNVWMPNGDSLYVMAFLKQLLYHSPSRIDLKVVKSSQSLN